MCTLNRGVYEKNKTAEALDTMSELKTHYVAGWEFRQKLCQTCFFQLVYLGFRIPPPHLWE